MLDMQTIPDGALVFIRVDGAPDEFVKKVFDEDTVVQEIKARGISILVLDKSCDFAVTSDEDLKKYGLMRINAADQ